jgi:regulator of protease activity HflC (stomatin/prohibitin superfamily)
MSMDFLGIPVVLFIVGALVFYAVLIVREYERGVVFQLGRFWAVKGPGLIIVIPGLQQMVKVDIRTVRWTCRRRT